MTPKNLKLGERLKLKDGALPQVKKREWILREKEDDSLLLIHENGQYGLSVESEQIDWEEYSEKEGTHS